MNHQLAALDIYTIVYELQDLIGSYIDKIYQLSPEEIIIRINNRKTKNKEILYVHSNGLFFRTTTSFETPMKPTTFAMTLRKYTSNGRIIKIKQHEFDRIIKIKIQKKEVYTLLFELIPNGNIILLNQNDLIIMPLKHQHWSQRSIRTNVLYQPPFSQVNPFDISEKECKQIIQNSDADLVRTFAVKLSLGGKYAEEFCTYLDIPKETPAQKLTSSQQEEVYDQLQLFLQPFRKHNFNPTLVFDNNKKEVTPFPLNIHQNKTTKSISSFSKGIQRIIPQKEEETSLSPTKKRIEKLLRQKNQQEEAIKTFDNKIQQKKHQGDVIYLHYNTVQKLLSDIQQNRKICTKKELSTFLNNKKIVKHFSPDSPLVTLILPDEHQNPTTVKIDYRKNVAENAEASYHQSKKLRQKKQGAIKALEQTEQKINSIEKKDQPKQKIKQKNHKQNAEKHFWFEQYRWCITSTGNLILGGKDAKTNDQLIKKHLENGDRYVHADIHGAPSCIIKNINVSGKTIPIPDESLQQACTFSACYSRSWKQFAEAQAYWVHPEQVSKTAQSGEFVPRGAFIIRGKRNYCSCKMRLGIGRISIDNTEKIMGGHPDAIKKWCDHYVIIEPGTKKSSTIAKEISKILHANVPEIQQVLPPGESRLISTSKKHKAT